MPGDERRSPSASTRRREEAIEGDPKGRLRRRDDPPNDRNQETGGFGTIGGDTYYGEGEAERQREREEAIRQEVCALLTRHSEIDASDLEVLVEGGEVTVQGTVEDRDMRWLVEDLAETVSGVSLVHNRVRIAKR